MACSDTAGRMLSKSGHRGGSQHLHKFKIGDAVVFKPGNGEVLKVATRGTITRLLPRDGDDYQYHVQVQQDGYDRRARESQLRAV